MQPLCNETKIIILCIYTYFKNFEFHSNWNLKRYIYKKNLSTYFLLFIFNLSNCVYAVCLHMLADCGEQKE